MALGMGEKINEGFVERGIGNSGFLQREIGRMNIEDLQSLRANVNESRAKLLNEQNIRENKSKQMSALNARRGVLSQGRAQRGGDGSFVNGQPDFVLRTTEEANNYLTQDNSQPGAGGVQYSGAGNSKAFEIVARNPDGTPSIYKFATTQELMDFLDKNPNIKENIVTSASDPLIRAGGLGNTARNLVFENFINSSLRANQSQVAELLNSGRGTGNPFEDFKSKVKGSSSSKDSNDVEMTQNEKGKLVDSVITKVTSPKFGRAQIRDAVIASVRAGKGFEVIQRLTKAGLL